MVSILLACSLDVRTFPVRFMSLSRINSLELHFRFQLNPLAYNYIATDEKRLRIFLRIFVHNICSLASAVQFLLELKNTKF